MSGDLPPLPPAPAVGPPPHEVISTPVTFQKPPEYPTGGATVYLRPNAPSSVNDMRWFRQAPNGGATTYVNPGVTADAATPEVASNGPLSED